MQTRACSGKLIVIGLLLSFIFPAKAVATEREESLVPILNCMSWIPERQLIVAILGYRNPNEEAVTIGVGPDNFFMPNPSNRGQPTQFQPGFHPRAFYLVFNPNFEQFVQWVLDGTDLRVELDSSRFCHPSVLSLAVSGSGTIAADPAIPVCTNSCTTSIDGPASLQLKATPDPGWSFSGYSGDEDCIDGEVSLEAGSLVSCRASFEPPAQSALAIAVFGNGSVTSSIGGLDCPAASCIADFDDNASVELIATPSPGAVFLSWAGDEDCLDGTVIVDAAKVCAAVFAPPMIFMDKFEDGSSEGSRY